MPAADFDNIAAPHPLASALRPVVDAGKARVLALEITRLMLVAVAVRDPGPIFGAGFAKAIHVLNLWLARALDVDTGREQQRLPAERLDLATIGAVADRLASRFWCLAKPGEPLPIERWALFDLATMLRRACECTDMPASFVAGMVKLTPPDSTPLDRRQTDDFRSAFENTADHLLPLIVEEARRMCVELQLDPSPIEAAIVRFGGVPS